MCRYYLGYILIKIKSMIEQIGMNAGKIWSALEGNGRQNVKEIKKATKLTDKDLYTAVGWLAREGKVALDTEEKEVFVSLC